MVKEINERKYQGVCRKCPCFEDSLHTDSGMWCYWFKEDDKPDCSARLALESFEDKIKQLTEQKFFEIKCNPELEKRLTELALDNLEKGERLTKVQDHLSDLGSIKDRISEGIKFVECQDIASDIDAWQIEHYDIIQGKILEGDIDPPPESDRYYRKKIFQSQYLNF